MRTTTYGVLLVLAAELAVWEAFLVGARPLGTGFPLAALLAVAGNVALGLAGAAVLGSRAGAVWPGVLWLLVALTLGSGRAEGDRVVPDSLRGFAFLLLGTVTAAVVVGAVRPATAPATTPGAAPGR